MKEIRKIDNLKEFNRSKIKCKILMEDGKVRNHTLKKQTEKMKWENIKNLKN